MRDEPYLAVCGLQRRGEQVFVGGAVRDLRSHNGTYIDDTRVESAELGVGHVVRLGKVSFVLAKIDGDESDCGSLFDTASVLIRSDARAQADLLSQAQRRVLGLALTGLVEKQIARRLHISRHTAHNHLRSIYRILGVHSRGELLAQVLSK